MLGKVSANRSKKISQLTKKKSSVRRHREAPRLYMKGTMTGYTRGLHGQNKNTSLIRIENVNTGDDATWYVGKRVCYVYHGYKMKRCVRWSKAPARRSNTRAIWGRVTRPHGGSGVVRAKFSNPLPAAAIGRRVRVYLYPSQLNVISGIIGSRAGWDSVRRAMATPYNCVVTSSAMYRTPFPITRLAADIIDENPIVAAVVGSDSTMELPCLVNLKFDSEQVPTTFNQLVQDVPRVYLPNSLYCSALSTYPFQKLSSLVCEGRGGTLHPAHRTASLYYYDEGASHKPRAVLKRCHSCAFYRDGLWCLSQLENGRQANVLSLHHNDLFGTLTLNNRGTYSSFGIVSSPISVERMCDNASVIFTSHGAFRCDCREPGTKRMYLTTSPVFSGGVCQNGEQILFSLEDDKMVVVDVRKASEVLYEMNTSFPVMLRTFCRGNVVLAISRRQVGVFHSGKLELLAALESSGTVLDAVSLKEKQHSVRVVFSSTDSSLRNCLVEF